MNNRMLLIIYTYVATCNSVFLYAIVIKVFIILLGGRVFYYSIACTIANHEVMMQCAKFCSAYSYKIEQLNQLENTQRVKVISQHFTEIFHGIVS